MHSPILIILAGALLAIAAQPAGAASLEVAPVTLEIAAPGAAATLTFRNAGPKPIDAQIRVFRWQQVNGEEKLEPTDDVVASPPVTSLAPNASYVVRLVRVTKQPVSGEESYRLLVDELPDAARQRNGAINLLLRYSIPVFFFEADAAEPNLRWSFEQRSGRTYLTAVNEGDRHVRVSSLKLRNGDQTISFGSGLTGYVLGRSKMGWAVPSKNFRVGAGNPVVIAAEGNHGPISTSPSMSSTR